MKVKKADAATDRQQIVLEGGGGTAKLPLTEVYILV
jgi:hypothetical protein